MRLHEAFNRSRLSAFLNSVAGRIFRLVAGAAFVAAGYAYRDHPIGLLGIVWGALAMSAGGFDVCYISAALGGPFRGAKIRRGRAGS